MADERFSNESAQARLRELGLTHWSLRDSCLHRVCRTADWRGSMLLANAIAHLAETAWHHPELRISWGRVEILLVTHSVSAITDKDLALAARIEELLRWRPAADSPLEGTPDDARWQYLLRD